MVELLLALQLRTIAIDRRLATDAHLRVGDTVMVSASSGAAGDSVVIAAIVGRRADPSEIARSEYRAHLHLDQLQRLIGYGDRVDRFAISTRGDSAADSTVRAINGAAFGFRAYRSREIAVETSETFAVVSRFHRAIGVITIVASAVFLLCILLLKVDERRRDVAALRLLGISRRSVMLTVVLEAAFVSVIGSGVGVVIGWVVSFAVNWHYQSRYQTPLRFTLVTQDIILFAVSLSLLLGIVAGALAARRLVRTQPLILLGR
jgi:putative ABC transport system permease protein